MKRLGVVLLAVLAACGMQWQFSPKPNVTEFKSLNDTLKLGQLALPNGALKVLNEAARSARQSQLELGGCATLEARKGYLFYVSDPYVSFAYTSRDSMGLVCRTDAVLWHTHVDVDDLPALRCQPSETDVKNTPVLGIIVCGIGKDSLIPFGWKRAKAGQ